MLRLKTFLSRNVVLDVIIIHLYINIELYRFLNPMLYAYIIISYNLTTL